MELGIGKIQKQTRIEKQLSQKDLADRLHLSRSMVAAVETDRRRLPDDVVPKAVEQLDDGFYAMEVASEMTGGAWTGKLTGQRVDLHRASVKEKALEELEEVLDQLQRTHLANRLDETDKENREQLHQLLIECIDAIVCLSHFVAVICKEYSISWVGIWREHRRKLKEKKYIA